MVMNKIDYKCKARLCNGCGMIETKKNEDGYIREYAYSCTCDRGIKGLKLFPGQFNLEPNEQLTEYQIDIINSYKKPEIKRKDWE